MNFVNFDIENNVFLAPMAGITDLAFRTICRRQGASLCYSEMISAKALKYNDKKTKELLKTNSFDNPLCIQLFGSEPETVAEAAKIIEDMGFSMIDINAGCPAPKIANNGEGAALMKDPILLGKIVYSAVKAVKIPVTVKIRSGYTNENINALECAEIIEESGASAITVHGRTRDQFYSGSSDYGIIKKVKQNLKIPVIGNGDIFSPEDAKKLMEETGCDAIMIARGSLGKPYLFRQINDYFEKGSYIENYDFSFKLNILISHIDLMISYKNEHRAILEARKHLAWYLKGIKNSKIYKEMANKVNTLEDVKNICNIILNS